MVSAYNTNRQDNPLYRYGTMEVAKESQAAPGFLTQR